MRVDIDKIGMDSYNVRNTTREHRILGNIELCFSNYENKRQKPKSEVIWPYLKQEQSVS